MGVKDFSFLPSFLGSVHCHYLMSDLKKCGLTFPRELLYATLEVLEEIYPESKIFRQGIDGYKNATILMPDGSTRKQTNGVNLGMMNEYVSFIMGCLVELWIEQRGHDDAEALMYNDDQIIRFSRREILELNVQDLAEIGLDWDEFMESYGLVVHEKKSFWSNRGCFLEVYGRPGKLTYTTYKEGQYIGNLYWSLLAYNICEAKEFCASIISDIPEHYMEKALLVLESIIELWGYEFSPRELAYSFPIGWIRERNDFGEYTLFDEIIEADVLKEDLYLIQVAKVTRPMKYSPSLKKASSAFKRKFDWFISEVTVENSPGFVKRLVENLCPPYLGVRKHDVFDSYQQWYKARRRVWQATRPDDPGEVIAKILRNNPNMHIPEELILGKANSERPDDLWDPFDVPERDSLSLREYLAFAKLFGEYKNFHVDLELTNEELRKVTEYFSFIHPGSELAVALLQYFNKSRVLTYLNMYAYGTGSIPKQILESEETWFPRFIPGIGEVIVFSEHIRSPLRVTYDNYSFSKTYFNEYAPLVAFALDEEIFSKEDILPFSNDLYYHLESEFKEETIEERYHLPSIDLFRTASEASESEYYSAEGDSHPPEEHEVVPPQRRERRLMSREEYLRYQVMGAASNLVYQLGPEARAEYFANYEAPAVSLDEPDVFGSECSDDGAFGSMFE
jgi:hypothetical protein